MTAKTYNVEAVAAFLPAHAQIEGNRNAVFANARTLEAADNTSIIWIASSKADKQKIAETTKATVIVCDSTVVLNADILKEKCLIKVDNPRLAFTRIVNELYRGEKRSGIHPSTVVSPEADIHPDCYIGPLSYIGKCTIGEGSIIHGRCYLYDGVVIGKNVIIHAGAVIGADGFGYSKNENGEPEKFPHIGGVIIEDDVEIGANTCIDKGALGNTIVKKGAKIDNLVHVAHNVVVGENSLVVALSLIGGSTVIGKDSWIAPSAIIRDGVSIGSKVTVGMGALVTKSIPDGETWAGSPARPLPEYLELQKKLKGL